MAVPASIATRDETPPHPAAVTTMVEVIECGGHELVGGGGDRLAVAAERGPHRHQPAVGDVRPLLGTERERLGVQRFSGRDEYAGMVRYLSTRGQRDGHDGTAAGSTTASAVASSGM